MEKIGTIISILVALITLLSVLVCFARFKLCLNVHDKKLDKLSDDVREVKELVFEVTIQDKKIDDLSKDIAVLKHDFASIRTLLIAR